MTEVDGVTLEEDWKVEKDVDSGGPRSMSLSVCVWDTVDEAWEGGGGAVRFGLYSPKWDSRLIFLRSMLGWMDLRWLAGSIGDDICCEPTYSWGCFIDGRCWDFLADLINR